MLENEKINKTLKKLKALYRSKNHNKLIKPFKVTPLIFILLASHIWIVSTESTLETAVTTLDTTILYLNSLLSFTTQWNTQTIKTKQSLLIIKKSMKTFAHETAKKCIFIVKKST